jgi:hypothetical protein
VAVGNKTCETWQTAAWERKKLMPSRRFVAEENRRLAMERLEEDQDLMPPVSLEKTKAKSHG